MSYTLYTYMAYKNKQYKVEKGLLLFTQPRSPYFYGKIRLKYGLQKHIGDLKIVLRTKIQKTFTKNLIQQ